MILMCSHKLMSKAQELEHSGLAAKVAKSLRHRSLIIKPLG